MKRFSRSAIRYLFLALLASGVLCSPLPSKARIHELRTFELIRLASTLGPSWLDSTEARASQFSCSSGGSPFTGSSTWTVPAGITDVITCGFGGGGGGGSGASNATNASGGGGGGGALYSCEYTSVTPGASPAVTIGAGGTAGAAATGAVGNNGGPGGTSSLATSIQWNGASGGAGGNISASTASGGGLAITSRNVNDYNTISTFSITGASSTGCVHSPQCGGCALSGGGGQAGDDAIVSINANRIGGAGGTAATAGGGGGGGSGALANGGAGGNGVASGAANAGASPAANTGAGGGGGGGQATATSASGAGGVGGSGKVWICTVL